MLWLRESWLLIVSCDPRVTVSACGQIAPFMMTSVFVFVLGVHDPDGDVLDELPPHDMATAATVMAAAAATSEFTMRMRLVLSGRQAFTILACTWRGSTT